MGLARLGLWQIVAVQPTKNRAAVVSVRDGQLLVIRRVQRGRRYAVLPGGGVELNEPPQDAALRELEEETGLSGQVLRHLWTLQHGDRVATYFLVAVPFAPMLMAGPEVETMSIENTYEPCWIPASDFDVENLQPAEIRALIRALAGSERDLNGE
jgi:8-oxo-dGTP pyrophosphatase MutT (NUDIX family)